MLDNSFINLSDLDKNDFGNERLALSLFAVLLLACFWSFSFSKYFFQVCLQFWLLKVKGKRQ